MNNINESNQHRNAKANSLRLNEKYFRFNFIDDLREIINRLDENYCSFIRIIK